MNILLWAMQIVLALHTAIGAIWKFSNSENLAPTLGSIPHPIWLGLISFEFVWSLGLIAPLFGKRFSILAPIAASCVAAEMLMFCAVHFNSGATEHGPVIYWLVVAAICAIIIGGRYLQIKKLAPQTTWWGY